MSDPLALLLVLVGLFLSPLHLRWYAWLNHRSSLSTLDEKEKGKKALPRTTRRRDRR